jgi:hypothetical protein
MLVRVMCDMPVALRDVFHHVLHAVRQFDEQKGGVEFYHKLPWAFCDFPDMLYRRHGYYAWDLAEEWRYGLDSNSFCWQMSQLLVLFVDEKTFAEKADKAHRTMTQTINNSDKEAQPPEQVREERPWSNEGTPPDTEMLGYYTRASGLYDQPAIVICPDRIWRVAQGNDDQTLMLMVKVLIHELAHAVMDANQEKKLYGKKDAFYHWVEESLANYLTLEVLQHYDPRFYDYAKNFIAHQSPAYRLGGVLHNAGLSLTVPQHWQRHKTKLGTKATPLLKQSKADWLNLAVNGQDVGRIAHDLASLLN